jgi:hypothetical protein
MAVLLVEATTHWYKRRIGFDPDPVGRHDVGNALEHGFIFRARLIAEMPQVASKQVVGM